jgi:hypothetical protein
MVVGPTVERMVPGLAAAVRGETAVAAGLSFGAIQATVAIAFGVGLLAPRPDEAPEPSVMAVPAVTALAIRDLLGSVPRFVGAAVVEVLAALRYALAFGPPERSCSLPKRGA